MTRTCAQRSSKTRRAVQLLHLLHLASEDGSPLMGNIRAAVALRLMKRTTKKQTTMMSKLDPLPTAAQKGDDGSCGGGGDNSSCGGGDSGRISSPAGQGLPAGTVVPAGQGLPAGAVVNVKVYNREEAESPDLSKAGKGWITPVEIAPEPLVLEGAANLDHVSGQYEAQGAAFVRPATLPPGLNAGTSTIEDLQEFDKRVAAMAKTPEWEKYVLGEIVGKGKLGSDRVRARKPTVATN
eukprot:g13940.t1